MLMMLEVYDLGWMDGMLNTRAISMQGSGDSDGMEGRQRIIFLLF